jgi:Domain of unknown function (DUF4440)
MNSRWTRREWLRTSLKGWFFATVGPPAGGVGMQSDRDKLRDLNIRIGAAESAGDKDFLAGVIAPKLAFRRANATGDCVDRDGFLKGVKESAERQTEIESINILSANRAIVTCLVTLKTDSIPNRFHNARLFIRDKDGQWKILGWANEPA